LVSCKLRTPAKQSSQTNSSRSSGWKNTQTILEDRDFQLTGKIIQFVWENRKWRVVDRSDGYRLEDATNSWYYFLARPELLQDAIAAGVATVVSQ
jgi:hypothetical protein